MATETPSQPQVDRRRPPRLVIPSCPICGGDDVGVVSRVDDALYTICNKCVAIWGVRYPSATT